MNGCEMVSKNMQCTGVIQQDKDSQLCVDSIQLVIDNVFFLMICLGLVFLCEHKDQISDHQNDQQVNHW